MSAVVYLGRIPHGFYEEEMREYFSQFGSIKNLRLSRNKQTGASKHYAFIEFDSPETAKVVAETMDQYLLYNSLLQCQVLKEVHPSIWKGANKRFKIIPKSAKIKVYNEGSAKRNEILHAVTKDKASEDAKRRLIKKKKAKMTKKLELLAEVMDYHLDSKAQEDEPSTPKASKAKSIITSELDKEAKAKATSSKSPEATRSLGTPSSENTLKKIKSKVENLDDTTPKKTSKRLRVVKESEETPLIVDTPSKRARQAPAKYSPRSPLYSTPRKTPRKRQ